MIESREDDYSKLGMIVKIYPDFGDEETLVISESKLGHLKIKLYRPVGEVTTIQELYDLTLEVLKRIEYALPENIKERAFSPPEKQVKEFLAPRKGHTLLTVM